MSELVESQYTKWIYPLPVADMAEHIQAGNYQYGEPDSYWPLYWPRKRSLGSMDILIAGCGTMQGAYYAMKYPQANVVAIDLSASSLEEHNRLKRQHGLNNLTVMKLNILDVSKLNQEFDFIVSTGVLHHMPDPDAGLRALKSVLKPEGVMNLMLYGMSLRVGVYMMQDLFRTLHFEQTQTDVELVKVLLQSLPAEHCVKRYMQIADDLAYDAGMVDTFLHPQDKAYYVNEIYEFAARANLSFINWADPIAYSLDHHVPADHPIWKKLSGLSNQEAAHACDLIVQGLGTHRFFLGHPDFVRQNSISFDSDDFLSYTVLLHRNAKLVQAANLAEQSNAILERDGLKFEIDYRIVDLVGKLNATNTIGTLFTQLTMNEAEKVLLLDLLRASFKKLYTMGHIYVLLPAEKGAI